MPRCASTACSSTVLTTNPSATGGGEELALALDVDEAHPADGHRGHARVVAEARNEDAHLLRDVDEDPARLGLDLLAVDRQRHATVLAHDASGESEGIPALG